MFFLLKYLVVFMIFTLLSSPVSGERGLSPEEIDSINWWVDRSGKFSSVSSEVINRLNDSQYKDQFEKLGKWATRIKVTTLFLNAEDNKAAWEITKTLGWNTIKDKLPAQYLSAITWFSWAKSAMELLKDFVVDPALTDFQLDIYGEARKALEPADAIALIPSYGHARIQVLKQFHKQYGNSAFVDGQKATQLLPRWQQKFDAYLNGWYEMQYQKRLTEQTKQKLQQALHIWLLDEATFIQQLEKILADKKPADKLPTTEPNQSSSQTPLLQGREDVNPLVAGINKPAKSDNQVPVVEQAPVTESLTDKNKHWQDLILPESPPPERALASCKIINLPKTLASRGDAGQAGVTAFNFQGQAMDNFVVNWISTNNDVASINQVSGEVTTQKPGSTTFIAQLSAPHPGYEDTATECIFNLRVDTRYKDLLISGKVINSEAKPVSAAQVRAGVGGVTVSSERDGSFSLLAGGGPYAEGATILVEAISGKQQGKAKAQVVRGQIRNLQIVIRAKNKETEKNESFNPVHFFQLQDKQGKTFYLLYARAEVSHLDKNKFRFPDGAGGYYHYAGVDLGVYKDKASICPVLRGKGVFSVSYNLGNWSVVCDKTVPVNPNQTTIDSLSASQASNQTDKSLEAQFLDYLMIDLIYGDVQLYLDRHQQTQNLTQKPVASGSTLVTANNASAQLSVAGTKVEVGAETSVRWLPADITARSPSQLELQQGNLLLDHPTSSGGGAEVGGSNSAEAPGFEGLEIVTPHAHIRPQGTRYRVMTNGQGTEVAVLIGEVRLTGKMLARTDTHFQLQGKYAFQTKLILKAGEYGKAFSTNVQQQAVPSWLDTQAAPETATRSVTGDSEVSALPGWLSEGNNNATAANNSSLLKPLSAAEPWLLPSVQVWMDQWLKKAHPAVTKPNLSFRYSDWGVLLSSAATAVGPPDHPAGWTRFRYLWERRDKLSSWNLCRLGEYLQHRQAQQALTDCIQPEPKPQRVDKLPVGALTKPKYSNKPELTKAKKETSRTFTSWLTSWSCQYQSKNKTWHKIFPFALSYNQGQLFLQYQRKRYPLNGLPENEHYLLIMDFPGAPVTLDLRMQGQTLTGNHSWTTNNIEYSNPVHCDRASPKEDIFIYGKR